MKYASVTKTDRNREIVQYLIANQKLPEQEQESVFEIAKHFGLSQSRISQIWMRDKKRYSK
jgi:DnaJ-domain-containing protein 1